MEESWVSSWTTSDRRTGCVDRPTCSHGKARQEFHIRRRCLAYSCGITSERPACPTQPPLTRVLVTSVPLLPPLFPFPPPPCVEGAGVEPGGSAGRKEGSTRSVSQVPPPSSPTAPRSPLCSQPGLSVPATLGPHVAAAS